METGKVEYAVTVRCSVERAWQLLTDVARLDGRGFYANSRWMEGHPWRKGSRFEFDLVAPVRTHASKVVTTCDPPRRLCMIAHGSGFTSEQWFTLKEDSDGVTIAGSAEYRGEATLSTSAAEIGSVLLKHLLDTLVTDCGG
jgi:hypothetical protein